MLQILVGNVDVNSAAVLVALAICICVMVTTMISKRRARVLIEHDFELALLKQHDEQQARMAALATDRDYKFKQIEQNLITSHERKRQTDD